MPQVPNFPCKRRQLCYANRAPVDSRTVLLLLADNSSMARLLWLLLAQSVLAPVASHEVSHTHPCEISSNVAKDPHISFAHGGFADFRGRNGQLYNFFSAPGLSVNVKTEDARFVLNNGRLTVDGSFITEVHVVARVGPRKTVKLAKASFWASQLMEENWGWKVINGSCGVVDDRDRGRAFTFGARGSKRCYELSMAMDVASATFAIGNWTVTVRGNHVYGWLSGPRHRVDVGFSAKGDGPVRSVPHGIVGQSFSSLAPRHGRTDEYPDQGTFRTSAMAEGAIEGEASMYEMATPHATSFAFSRFDDALESSAPLLNLGAAEASATDRTAGFPSATTGRWLSEAHAPCPPPVAASGLQIDAKPAPPLPKPAPPPSSPW